MKAAYKEWETGGGCRALIKELPSGRHFLITDEEGCDLPTEGAPAMLGMYSRYGEPIGNGVRLIVYKGGKK